MSKRFDIEHIRDNSHEIFHRMRWGDSFSCPHCGHIRSHPTLTNITATPVIIPSVSVCNHTLNQYMSDDGYSSNPIENHFAHLKRMWHGIYQWFSRKYCQGYLNEFCFRYNHRKLKLVDKIKSLFSLIIATFQMFMLFRLNGYLMEFLFHSRYHECSFDTILLGCRF